MILRLTYGRSNKVPLQSLSWEIVDCPCVDWTCDQWGHWLITCLFSSSLTFFSNLQLTVVAYTEVDEVCEGVWVILPFACPQKSANEKHKNSFSKSRFELGLPEKKARLQNSWPEPPQFPLRGLSKWNQLGNCYGRRSKGHHTVITGAQTNIPLTTVDGFHTQGTPCASTQTGWTTHPPFISSGMRPTGCEAESSPTYTQECCEYMIDT